MENHSESSNHVMIPTEREVILNVQDFIDERMNQLKATYRVRSKEIGKHPALRELLRGMDALCEELDKLPRAILPMTARPVFSTALFKELYEDMEADLEARGEEL